MAEADPVALDAPEAPALPPGRSWWRRLLRAIGWGLFLLVAGFAMLVWAIDTGPGHRLLTSQIARLPIKSGLGIRIGRIEGSIWDKATLRDVRLSDPQGVFLEAPELHLDWHPGAWLANRLDIERADSDLVLLHRLPKLRSSGRQGPILPGFDIRIGALDIGALRLGPAIAGRERTAAVHARADIHHRRALIDLRAEVAGGGDRVALTLDAAPDANRFDVEARVDAPANSVVGALAGTKRPLALVVTGDGTWAKWRGRATLDLSGRRAGDLKLAADAGRYRLAGMAAPSPFVQGKQQRLTAPRVAIEGVATLAERRLTGRLSLRSAALALRGRGTLDLARSAFDGVRVEASLLKPEALFPNMTGRSIGLAVDLNGPFKTAGFRYALSAPRFAFDKTGFEEARAAGEGRLSRLPIALPIRFTAKRVTGVGTVAGGILGNLSLAGVLHVDAKTLTGDGMDLRSDKLNGKLSLLVDLVSGAYDVSLSGGLNRYLIPGLGIVDVLTELKVVPDPSGHGTRVEGRGRAWVRRFDNGFLRSLAGGLPSIDTRLVRGGDGLIHFAGLRLTAPALSITANGLRRLDGSFQLSGEGTQASYGPFTIALDGQIDHPHVDLVLAHPVDPLGLRAVRLTLDPDPQGFTFQSAGGSTLGPFAASGRIQTPAGGLTTIMIAALDVTGARFGGALRADPGGFSGQLQGQGGGLGGTLTFRPQNNIQRIDLALRADGAKLAGAIGASVRRGRLDGTVLLDPAGTAVDATITAQGVRRGGVSLARLAAGATLKGGKGTIKASLAGSRGRAFELQTVTAVAPDRYAVAGGGTVDGRPIKLTAPAVLTRDGGGWRLAPTGIEFAGGTSSLSGRFGSGGTTLDATLDRMPLSVLDIAAPNLGLGGIATGKLGYRLPDDGGAPSGRADLRISGLTRSGLVLSSRPIDVGLAAVLNGRGAAMRAVMASGGQPIGRAQARIAPLAAGGALADRLAAAPLFAQLRYAGPADTLWRLTGVETIDLSGPVAIGADVGGSLDKPVIRGSLRTAAARLESATTGTVIEAIKANGRFDGSRLVLDSFAGTAGKGGAVSGRAAFDFAAANGLGMDIALTADQAVLLNRDDIGATVTGPLTMKSDGNGGTIAGDVKLDKGRFRLGQAAAAQVARLKVREINRPADEPEERAVALPWRLDLKAHGSRGLQVTGLGLDSDWRTDLVIKGSVDNPAIGGRADLVRGGYEFAGRRFDLDRGSIRFGGDAPPDPVLDIAARADIQGLDATIRVAGTGLKPEISFQSVPALPEDELLSRLLFGSSITNLSAPEALQLAAAVASLRNGGNGGLNPINAVRRVAGLDRLRILPADTTTGQGTSIAAGKYLGRRTYVEIISDGQGYSATRLEYQVTRWLSLLSTISTIGRQSANVRVSKDY